MNACMTHGYVLPGTPHEVVDHRYFFATRAPSGARIGAYTCGVAREALARGLRRYGRNALGDFYFLLRALPMFADNPSVTGFLIEQAVLSSIGNKGLDISEGINSPMETVMFGGDFPEIHTRKPLTLYCPLQCNLRAIDGLVVRFTDQRCFMFPVQISIRKVTTDCEAWFFDQWPLWIRGLAGYEIEVQFVWVVESTPASNEPAGRGSRTLRKGRHPFNLEYRRWRIPLKDVDQQVDDWLERARAARER